MKQTLNQIVKYISDFASNHNQIHDFSFGDLEEISNINNTSINYPLLHIQTTDSSITNEHVYLKFNCLCMDLTNKDENNSKDVLNDCLLILNDLRSYFNKNKEFHSYGITIEDNTSVTPFTERFRDEVTGWNLELTFKIRNNQTCNIPFVSPTYTSPAVPTNYLELVYDNYANIPYYTFGEWATFFNINFTAITITNSTIKLYGDASVTSNPVPQSAFYQNPYLLQFNDVGGFITSVAHYAFQECYSLNYFHSPTVVNLQNLAFTSCAYLSSVTISACTTIQHTNCFSDCTSLINIDLSSCTNVGASTSNEFTFFNIVGNTINLKLKSGTETDADIDYLLINNTVNLTLV